MTDGKYVSLEQFKEFLFSGETKQLSCWRSQQSGCEEELLQCFEYKNTFYIRIHLLNTDICKSFVYIESANRYFKSVTRSRRYIRIKENN